MTEVRANMTGSVWKVVVSEGDKVDAGAELVILESMKMEIPITTEESGVVQELKVSEGDFVNEGDIIALVE